MSDYLKKLHELAEEKAEYAAHYYVSDAARDKNKNYWENVLSGKSTFIYPITKDLGGDPKCPLNDKIRGVWFNPTYQPDESFFGNMRYTVDLDVLLKDCNLFFADFYCKKLNGPHYFTIVSARMNTKEHNWCVVNLILLDIDENPFISQRDVGWEVTKGSWVEIFHLHELKVQKNNIVRVNSGGRTSRKFGLPKFPSCSICSVTINFGDLDDLPVCQVSPQPRSQVTITNRPTSIPLTHASIPVTYASTPLTHASLPVTYASTPVTYASTPVTYASTPNVTTPVTYASTPNVTTPVTYASTPNVTIPERHTVRPERSLANVARYSDCNNYRPVAQARSLNKASDSDARESRCGCNCNIL